MTSRRRIGFVSTITAIFTILSIITVAPILFKYLKYYKSTNRLQSKSEDEKINVFNSVTNETFYSTGTGVIKAPAVYLTFKGGLGNQLFLYACSYALARKNNFPLYVHLPSSMIKPDRDFRPQYRNVAMDFFNISFNDWNVVNENVTFEPWKLLELNDADILAGTYSKESILHHTGYCQSEVFFSPYKEEIIQMFALKLELITSPILQQWEELINLSKESVAVHIRLGDFTELRRVPISFTKSAMRNITRMLKDAPRFFIFSDDIDKVKKDFEVDKEFENVNYEIYFVSNPNATTSIQEFYLMYKCRHNIIPSSSYSWWAAYLNKNSDKIVIAAHYNMKAFDSESEYKEPYLSYIKFEYKYIYYPYRWIVYDPFS